MNSKSEPPILDGDLSLLKDLQDPLLKREACVSADGSAVLARGSSLDRFVILDCIGEGGMGIVYSAYDSDLDRKIAVKLVLPALGLPEKHEQLRELLLREAKALGKLSHPNVVTVFEVGTFDDQVFIAMEFVDGQTARQWIREKGRTQAEVLDLFIQAGTGLMAAHQVGLVHRDIKLDNILVGQDGRVRVTDFGLACAAVQPGNQAPGDPPKQVELPAGQVPIEKIDLTSQSTPAGGTPDYMSPEALLGQKVDERSDQFSFCVALYEGLTGMHPFRGESSQRTRENTLSGRLREWPTDCELPEWLRRILERGLSVGPQDRFDSVEELLQALQDDPTLPVRMKKERRRRQWFLALALLMTFAAGTWIWAVFAGRPGCRDGEAKASAVWNPAVQNQIQQAFLDTKLPYAEDTWSRVRNGLNDYTAKWASAHDQTCASTWHAGTQSEKMFDLSMWCLKQRMNEAKALIDVFQQADAQILEKATLAVKGLGSIAQCQDVEVVSEGVKAPTDEKTRTKVEEIRTALARVKALERTGKYRQGLELAQQLIEQANRSGYEPVRAEVTYSAGTIQSKLGQLEDAQQSLSEAIYLADKARHDRCRAKVLVALVDVLDAIARYKEGLLRAHETRGVLERISGTDLLIAELDSSQGRILMDMGQYQKAWQVLKQALSTRERLLGKHHPDTADSLNDTAYLFFNLGKFEEAEHYHQGALAIHEEFFGAGHPAVARSMNKVAFAHKKLGKYQLAEPLYKRALVVLERTLGPDHMDTAQTLNNLAMLYQAQGRYDQAVPILQRAVNAWKKTLGPRHPETATGLNNLAMLFHKISQYDQAELLLKESLSIRIETLGPESIETAECLNNLASMYKDQGEYQQAEPLFLRSLIIREKVLGPQHPGTAKGLGNLAGIYDMLNKFEQAEPLFLRALSIFKNKAGPEHPHTATTLYKFALMYVHQGSYKKAESLLEQALAIQMKALGSSHPSVSATSESLRDLYLKQGKKNQAETMTKRMKEIEGVPLYPGN